MTREELYELGLKKKKGEIQLSWNELNEQYKKPFKDGDAYKSFVNKKYKRESLKEVSQNPIGYKIRDKKEYRESLEIDEYGRQVSDKLIEMSEEESKDINFVLNKHGYKPSDWKLIKCRNNIWNVYSCQDGVQTLYSSVVVVEPRTEYDWSAENIDKIIRNIKFENKINVASNNYAQNGKLLVVPIADLHYNLSSDLFSTGNEYNANIAEEYYYKILNDIIDRNIYRSFEKVLFVVGNDFINADNIAGTTTKGTPQENDLSWFEVVENVPQLLVNGIDMLSSIAPVDVLYVPSNHDLHTMYGIMGTLKAYYRTCDNVRILNNPMFNKYYLFGNTLLMFSHDIKVKDALKIISTEARDYWSRATHVVCMLAHLHQV
jgi:hypothetical protein